MILCSLCNDIVSNLGQLDHYIDDHSINVNNIWITDAIIKNSGETLFTYKRMGLQRALELGLQP